jgi:hypothetical protein
LIQRLTSDLQPVRRLRPVAVRVAGWFVVALASLGLVMVLMGVRRELGDAADRADFAIEAALLIVTALSAAVGALMVSIPGADRGKLVRSLPIVIGTTTIVWALGELLMASATGAPTGRLTFAWHCVYKTASVAAIPSVMLFVMIKRAAPLHAARAGFLAILATAAVGVLGANIICPNDRPLHMLLWHAAPLMLFAALGAGLGTWLLRWKADEVPPLSGGKMSAPLR